MKIFVISRGFPTSKDPQWGNFEFDHAKALSMMGHKVIMLSVDVRWKSKNRMPGIKINKEGGVTSYDFYCGPWVVLSRISLRLYDSFSGYLVKKLFQYVQHVEGRPDVIYSHYLDSSDYALCIKRKYNIPVVGLEHWSELGKKDPSTYAINKAKSVYPQLDYLFVVSNALKQNIFKLTGIKSDVLPNVIGSVFFMKNTKRNPSVVKFVSTGNLLPIKRMDLIIQALHILIKKGFKADITIVGDGPERGNLQQMINALNLEHCVHLVGRKTRHEIVDILNDSDVYIMASSSETFGVAAAEALACGIPAIVTDCGGPRDFVTSTNGIIIPINDAVKLADAMEYMINHCSDYDHVKISEDFHNKFSPEAVAIQITNVFNKVIEK